MPTPTRLTRRAATTLAVGLLIAVLTVPSSGAGANVGTAALQPLVTVVRHGGLCVAGSECRWTLRINDASITGDGFRPRRLRPVERTALLRAIRALDPAYVRAHPFRGTCPIAYDGTESIYRFRGFKQPLASCRYDLRRVEAVQRTERLLATLKPR
jgi:hypothetical protein